MLKNRLRLSDENRKNVLSQIREKVDQILKAYEPLPLGENIEKELAKISKRASGHS